MIRDLIKAYKEKTCPVDQNGVCRTSFFSLYSPQRANKTVLLSANGARKIRTLSMKSSKNTENNSKKYISQVRFFDYQAILVPNHLSTPKTTNPHPPYHTLNPLLAQKNTPPTTLHNKNHARNGGEVKKRAATRGKR